MESGSGGIFSTRTVKRAEVFLSLSALDKLRSLKGAQRTGIARFIDSLKENPSSQGDYTTVDETGRILQITLIERYAVIYWHDSPVSEIKVTAIISTT